MSYKNELRKLDVESYRGKKLPQQPYLMLDDLTINWVWEEKEVRQFDRLCRQGRTVSEISQIMDRPKHEVELLKIDRQLKGVKY